MSADNAKSKFIKSALLRILIVVVLVALTGGAVLWFGGAGSKNELDSDVATFTVKRGPLTISLTESGTIKARDQVILKNEVEGRTSIISLVDEGVKVKKGDLLVELDSSGLVDNKVDQEIRVQNAEASFVNASENLEVTKNQAQSDIDKAQLAFDFAKQDLKKYIEGEFPNQLQEAEAKITLAEEELARAKETLKWSKTLFKEKFISQTELQADELAEKKKALDLKLAQNKLDLLKNFTYQRDLAQLESDVKQAEMALERTTRKARADVVQAEADLKAREAEYNRQKSKLKKIEDQIEKTKIYSPVDSQVIYATSAQRSGWRGRDEPLDEGQEVRERQELIYLPTADLAKAEVDIHESSLEKIRLGLPTIITVDALPGKKFFGTVVQIAPLPDAQSMWMNPDLKVYNTDINIDNHASDLRTGMSCQAEIIIERYEDALYIPVQAVLRVGRYNTVFVFNGKDFEPRKVEIGLDNNRMVRIISGLEEGEVVTLTPPLKAAAVIEPTSEDTSSEDMSFIEKNLQSKPVEQAPAEKQPEVTMPSPEQMEEMRKKFENMSPEEKEKLRKRFENMSPEERGKKMRRGGRPGPGRQGTTDG
ncbi:MAG: hypothetical protein PVG93_01755 [Phycisphaerales bacterium]|jgi:HlyD family secretion protein